MTLACLIALAMSAPSVDIARDDYGVPHIVAATAHEAFFKAGYAEAQDRLWQMENSRRVARGKMAEAFGPQFVASDKEVLTNGYSDSELQAQFDALSPEAKAAFQDYAKGVNAWIAECTAKLTLPKGYADSGFTPEPWTVLDSSAIAVRLFQIFGRSSAGQLRDLALLTYLQGRKESKAHALDILDDLVWQNDPKSPTTVAPEDDLAPSKRYHFPTLNRAITDAHLTQMPAVGLFELLPGVSLAERSTSRLVAENRSVPFRTGSYAMVVDGKHSKSSNPLLLSGPQMGFSQPSIIHEMSIEAPAMRVSGMDVPGVPGIAVGITPNLAWGLTTGVADVEDVEFFKVEGEGYRYDDKTLPLLARTVKIKVKGQADQELTVKRTFHGPVILKSSSGYYFARHASTWMKELKSIDALFGLYHSTTPDQIDKAMDRATVNFNFFYATKGKGIGYRYTGIIPARADGLDPRFPVPGDPKFAWKSIIPAAQLPRVRNPKGGILTNWNNKPAQWWNNGDTPAWGRIFHVDTIRHQLPAKNLTTSDLEHAAYQIARTDPNFPFLKKYIAADLPAFNGTLTAGSSDALMYLRWVAKLRKLLFEPSVGNMMSPDLFSLAIQPSVMLAALEHRSAFDYLAGRDPVALGHEAYLSVIADLEKQKGPEGKTLGFNPGGIAVEGQDPIPYSNRGTYIQIIELGAAFNARNVVQPGVAETGPHKQDQVPLARNWKFKPMRNLSHR